MHSFNSHLLFFECTLCHFGTSFRNLFGIHIDSVKTAHGLRLIISMHCMHIASRCYCFEAFSACDTLILWCVLVRWNFQHEIITIDRMHSTLEDQMMQHGTQYSLSQFIGNISSDDFGIHIKYDHWTPKCHHTQLDISRHILHATVRLYICVKCTCYRFLHT